MTWAGEYSVVFDSKVLSALNTLLSLERALSSEQLLLLLELLRAYADKRVFDNTKCSLEKRSDQERSLARRLRTTARKAVPLLSVIDPEFIESLRTTADNIENYSKLAAEFEVGDVFSRSFSETTCFLVFATELVTDITGKPHYRELAELLTGIALTTPNCPRSKQELSAEDIRKTVKRFKERQPEFVEDFLAKDTIERQSRKWITAWQSAEEKLRGTPKKSPFRGPSAKKNESDSVPAESIAAKEEQRSDQD